MKYETTMNIEQTPSVLMNIVYKDGSRNSAEGKRKRFLRELLLLQALKKFSHQTGDEHPLSNDHISSEYITEYCQENFVPILENRKVLIEKQINHPLYGGSISRTIYNDKITKELLKRRSTVLNVHEPFRRNSSFTVPIEDRLTE